MAQLRLRTVLLLLFLPAVANILISYAISAHAAVQAIAEGAPLREVGLRAVRAAYTYSFYWSILQVCFGLYAAKLMGGSRWLREQYALSDLTARPLSAAATIAGLALLSEGLIWAEQLVMAQLYGGWEGYMASWREVVRGIPLWSKLYFVCVAPLTAGVFEEVIWRGFGVTQLEGHTSTQRAVLLQAVAFGLWHGLSPHALVTFLIGLAYGYAYAKRRRLLALSVAHVAIDVVGFYFAFMA